jgi:cytochrome b561
MLFTQIPLAWYMTDLPLGPDKFVKYGWHKSLGMLLFAFAVFRLINAIIGSRPDLPPGTKKWEKILAKATQGLLYLLVMIMPITGWMMSSAADVPVNVFGVLQLPMLTAPNKELMESTQSIHEMQSWALMTLVLLHLGAGLKHQFLLKNNVLHSMLPLIKKR